MCQSGNAIIFLPNFLKNMTQEEKVEKNKITVIVPMYNTEEYIERCIRSIMEQTYKNLEIIIVNDGSTDKSLDICKKLQKDDNRIVIVNQKNKGVGEARNRGIDVATGDFISFVDSDDTMDKNFYKELIATQLVTGADIVVANVNCIDDNNQFFPYGNNNLLKNYNKEEFIKLLLNFKIGNAVWGKLFKQECIRNLKFKDIKINEDFIFFWDVVKKSTNFSINFNARYNYYINTNGSLTKKEFTKENMSMIEHIDNVLKDVNSSYPDLRNDAINYYNACLLHNLILYYDYLCSDDVEELYFEEINDMILRSKELKNINNYFLVPERDVNVDILLNTIKEKIKRGVR